MPTPKQGNQYWQNLQPKLSSFCLKFLVLGNILESWITISLSLKQLYIIDLTGSASNKYTHPLTNCGEETLQSKRTQDLLLSANLRFSFTYISAYIVRLQSLHKVAKDTQSPAVRLSLQNEKGILRQQKGM